MVPNACCMLSNILPVGDGNFFGQNALVFNHLPMLVYLGI
jgi:hypothetical protein